MNSHSDPIFSTISHAADFERQNAQNMITQEKQKNNIKSCSAVGSKQKREN